MPSPGLGTPPSRRSRPGLRPHVVPSCRCRQLPPGNDEAGNRGREFGNTSVTTRGTWKAGRWCTHSCVIQRHSIEMGYSSRSFFEKAWLIIDDKLCADHRLAREHSACEAAFHLATAFQELRQPPQPALGLKMTTLFCLGPRRNTFPPADHREESQLIRRLVLTRTKLDGEGPLLHPKQETKNAT